VQSGELSISSIVHSELTRAVQTATLIKQQLLSMLKLLVVQEQLLNEGTSPANMWKREVVSLYAACMMYIILCFSDYQSACRVYYA
jgi:phosphohistidine phosphatase SixA